MSDSYLHDREPPRLDASDAPPPGSEMLLKSNLQIWSGLQAMVWRLPPVHHLIETVGDQDVLTLHLHGPVRLRRRFEGQNHCDASVPGSLCLDPKLLVRQYAWDGVATVLNLCLMPSLLHHIIAEVSSLDPARVELKSLFNFGDPLLEHISLAMKAELETDALFGQPYVEALSHALVLHLLRHYSSKPLQPHVPAGRLSQQQIRQVRDYIYDHMAQGIALKHMAASLGLSVSYFIHLFKEATGLTPHQYVIACRIDRAKHLLQEPGLTIIEVAQRVGFTDQSHLHRHLKRSIGVTPGELRGQSKNIQERQKNIQDDPSMERA